MNSDSEILLVEDNPSDRKLTLRAFKKYNLLNHITIAEDGEEALDFLFKKGKFSELPENQYPKLILLDLKLPKVSGVEVLKVIKSEDKFKNIPVVVMTSSKEDSDIIECYSLGVNSYVVKPVNFEDFMEVVGKLGMYWLLLNEAPVK